MTLNLFFFLGMHPLAAGIAVRAFLTEASRVAILQVKTGEIVSELELIHGEGRYARVNMLVYLVARCCFHVDSER